MDFFQGRPTAVKFYFPNSETNGKALFAKTLIAKYIKFQNPRGRQRHPLIRPDAHATNHVIMFSNPPSANSFGIWLAGTS